MARSHIAGPAELSIPFVLDKNPTVVPVGSAGERLGGALMELLARTQSEQLRRLALASGIRLLRSFGINRLDGARRGAGW